MKLSMIFLSPLFFASCLSNQKLSQTNTRDSAQLLPTPQFTPGPATLVYKTKNNYNNLVPILLSADKKEILSYPDPRDLRHQPEPSTLKEGYLLDNRGIGLHVAYLKLTYEEYAALTRPPSIDELRKMTIDTNPLITLYDCGNRNTFSDVQKELDQIISSGRLSKLCKRIK